MRLNWNPEGGDDYNIPCGTVRVTTSWHLNAIDLVYAAVSQPKERSTAADTLRRLIKKKLFDESDITYVVHSQYKKIGIVSFAKAIKLLMVLGGKTAWVEREKFARVLHLFYAGDAELKAEIDSNAISQEWLNVLAKEALSAERVAATDLQLVPAGGTSNADRHAASAGALPPVTVLAWCHGPGRAAALPGGRAGPARRLSASVTRTQPGFKFGSA